MGSAEELWGIDLGGTKIEGVICAHAASGGVTTLQRQRVATEQQDGYEAIIERIGQLVDSLATAHGRLPPALGIGTPGVLDPRTGRLKNSNTQCLNGMPLKSDLERRLGIPVQIANDANCFALAESRFGAASGKRSVFGVILGTGVGGGVVLDGKALYGAQGIAGEWGHNVLNPSGKLCYCGKQGCVETEISGPALEDRYASWTGHRIRLGEIAQRAASGEVEAQALMDFVVDSFAKAIAVVINILDPEVVVVGGGVSNLEPLYSRVPEYLRRYVFNDSVATAIVRNVLGDSAGVFGAALLVAHE